MGILSTMETRSTLKDPEAWLLKAFGSNETGSGVDVTEDSALGSAAVWAAVRIISETVASVPLNLYERRADGGRDLLRDHPLYSILHDNPNPELTALEFREMQTANVLLSGNSYAEIVRNGAGRISQLWPLWPHRVRVLREGGRRIYEVTLPEGGRRLLNAEQVLHVRGMSRGGLAGLDPIKTTQESVGLTLALERFFAKFFGNGSRPGGILEHPGKVTEDAAKRLKTSWEGAHKGLDNSHRVAILEEGLTWKQMGVSPEQAQAIEARKFQVTEVARIFNLPPHLLRDLERATFSNIEQQSIEFATYTIRGWAVRFEQRYNKQLLTDAERPKFYTKHVLEGLLRGDIKSRFEAYSIARMNGWLNANDIRELEDQNPIPGGETYMVQSAMIPMDMAGENFVPEPPPEGNAASPPLEKRTEARSIQDRQIHRRAYAKVFEDVAERVVSREVNAVRRAVKKTLGARDATDFRVWLDEFYATHSEHVAKAFARSIRSYAELVQGSAAGEVGGDVGMTPDLDKFADEYAETLGAGWAANSSGQLRKLLKDTPAEELEAVLLGRLDEWEATRAAKVGRRESVDAGEALVIAAYGGLGVTRIRSKATGESCPYCRALDGKVVGIMEPMLEAGEFQPEGAEKPLTVRRTRRHPEYHDGCDCYVLSA